MKKHILKENYDRLFGKREFGDPLHTFKGVMEKHKINEYVRNSVISLINIKVSIEMSIIIQVETLIFPRTFL